MGMTAVKIRLMPTAVDINFEKLKEEAKEKIEQGEGKNVSFEEQPIAFGLKAIIAFFALNESKELEPIEESLRTIADINSVEVIDIRRAFG